LSAGANPGARDIDGTTALILLVASIEEARDVYLSSRLRILNFLIDQGADINGRGFMGRTVLMLSVRACASIDFVAKLLEHGADVNILCDQGKTALHYAQKPDIADASMSVEYTKLLVKCGANYNDRDEVGFSPLILAILSKNEDVVQFITKLQCRSLSAFIYKEVYFFRIDLIQVYGYVSQDGADLYDVLTQEVSQSGSGYFTIKDLQANEEHMISMDWNGNIQKIRQVSGECFEWGIVSEPPLQQGNPDQSIALVRVRGNAVLFFNENGVLIGERRFGPRWALTPANYINQDETFKISGKGAVRIQGTAILLLTLANIHLTQEGTLDGLLSYGEPAVIDLFEGSGNFECNVDISLSERADIAVVIHRPEGDNKGTIRLKDKQWIAC
jgi:ankyrin repeat protein